MKYKRVLVDVDGVVANYVEGWKALTGYHPDCLNNLSKAHKDLIKGKVIGEDKLFLNLPIYDGAKEFIEFLKEKFEVVEFYTATGHVLPLYSEACKRTWLEENFSGIKVNACIKAREKIRLSDENSILIDDRMKSKEAFDSGKGLCILHTPGDFEKTKLAIESLIDCK